ncbi:ANTH domain-domain-containing protein [Yarrowia lipolytica]|jgi:hypothetical protein|uniref:YALI0C07502p n=2 Tax=Yarrowia lipolytica TaxID=4952 RepID=Q6CCQ4_YARLI|nr:YALI0C07502p [Yarrowia lipolytica CLIB122]KAB8280341.1 ANTH domain-containing protein [Yarrowia lipolytica]KAE8169439.1 ANTH domain-containing protein [Yarrowia lipolytica]KAJ8053175.1 ANTH domain-containing protein [Yarrowia lipolytica]QNP97398.1 Endocytosis protein end4 [Yarrowia lipolytica]RDW27191.1 ANTH domain-domain-containing protein [Yarrowia lipolytica]|eukprot:XP_501558.1 YALI0C07502p [Yarrowia lipolytica CLIB122]
MSSNRAEVDLNVNIKKATNTDESAPKRKHVRACIVYTHDHRSSKAFWNGIRIQPLQTDDVMVFKALITIHKVLQEGHPSALRDAQANVNFIQSLARGNNYTGPNQGNHGYGKLISEYVRFLMQKLTFHKYHPAFNGMFEYEDYISLRTVNDPNEGYEAIMNLMTLQDGVDDFQRLVFSSLQRSRSNECKISSLVPMIAESYGIYRFVISMLRAMHVSTGNDEALESLRQRFYSQHDRLRDFYYDCSTLKYLRSIVTIPQLGKNPPNLLEEEDGPGLPQRPKSVAETRSVSPEPAPLPVATPTPSIPAEAQPIENFWSQDALLAQQQYDAEQERLRQQQAMEEERIRQMQMQQQQQFEMQQRQQMEAQQRAQEQLMADQMARHAQGRMAELERDILALRGQYDQDQLMLEQYDGRVKALEAELNQLQQTAHQSAQAKDDLIESLQQQITMWRQKYETLAKRYSSMREEYLALLKKLKATQQKAASAKEAIEKAEKLERDMRHKNIELADLIKERDRARYDLDRAKGGNKEDVERLERELRMAQDKLADKDRSTGADLSLLLSKHNRELSELENALKMKQRALDERGDDSDLLRRLEEKEIEYEALNEAFNSLALHQEQQGNNSNGGSTPLAALHSIIDALLESGSQRVQDALFELESPMQAGNQNSTPEYLLSVIEKASESASAFATSFNNFLADETDGDYAEIIKTVNIYSTAVENVLSNSKGLTRLAKDDASADALVNFARESAEATERNFIGLLSEIIEDFPLDDKMERVITLNMNVQTALQHLTKLAERMAPKTNINMSGDLGDLVEREMAKAADAIAAASAKLGDLLKFNQSDPLKSTTDLQLHEAAIQAAQAVINAIAALIRAATDAQNEIVAQGRGTSSRAQFYKKNNKWTEGLISAAKSVAASTNILIEKADGTLRRTSGLEELIVASNNVAASTAQLVAASRVKATFMSKTQDKLEECSKVVTSACRNLVKQVQEILNKKFGELDEKVDYAALSKHEFKTTEMEQQVEILKLENDLQGARKRLGQMRKVAYLHQDEEESIPGQED